MLGEAECSLPGFFFFPMGKTISYSDGGGNSLCNVIIACCREMQCVAIPMTF